MTHFRLILNGVFFRFPNYRKDQRRPPIERRVITILFIIPSYNRSRRVQKIIQTNQVIGFIFLRL